ncbi:hypothetical protein ABT033_18690 [Streptomyces pharetrae]|uniref:hypothetical protein n=1 Tax=Streptomyces pharetrae TaxID=291370 RepID=UPI00335F09D2
MSGDTYDDVLEEYYASKPYSSLIPRHRVGFRVRITVLGSDEDIGRLAAVLTRPAARHPLRSRSRADRAARR